MYSRGIQISKFKVYVHVYIYKYEHVYPYHKSYTYNELHNITHTFSSDAQVEAFWWMPPCLQPRAQTMNLTSTCREIKNCSDIQQMIDVDR